MTQARKLNKSDWNAWGKYEYDHCPRTLSPKRCMRGLELDFRNDMFYIKFLFKPGTGETPYCIHTWRSPVSAYEMKNIAAYLKGFSKQIRMAFSFLKFLFLN